MIPLNERTKKGRWWKKSKNEGENCDGEREMIRGERMLRREREKTKEGSQAGEWGITLWLSKVSSILHLSLSLLFPRLIKKIPHLTSPSFSFLSTASMPTNTAIRKHRIEGRGGRPFFGFANMAGRRRRRRRRRKSQYEAKGTPLATCIYRRQIRDPVERKLSPWFFFFSSSFFFVVFANLNKNVVFSSTDEHFPSSLIKKNYIQEFVLS